MESNWHAICLIKILGRIPMHVQSFYPFRDKKILKVFSHVQESGLCKIKF